MNSDYKTIPLCLCCKKDNQLFLDLGLQPLANNYHKLEELCEVYPLQLKYCSNCFHCQLSHAVDPEILFKTYKYVSGTSQTGLNFFKNNAKLITDYKENIGKVLDIASNDGTQLDFFKELGWETYGVDPATNLCPIALEKGHKIICDFWNENSARQLPIMDVITAQNVFAHTQYIDDFLQNCKVIMDDNSSLFIQTSQKNMIINNEFDTTYHEHISFFNTLSMKTLVERNGLFLNNISEASIHGSSYIFEIGKKLKIENNNIEDYLLDEKNKQIYNEKTYHEFNVKTQNIISNLKLEIFNYKKIGYKCIGFGAAAKGQTVLCYSNINLDYIIDENPLKIDLYSPKMNIPIVDIDYFINDSTEKIVVLILAWNFANEIKDKIRKYKGNKEIIIIEAYFPEIVFRKLL
uniref:Methyltransferase putative zinc binding domain-containing protein n=1 Tax=viral metagenome TaxID=1070528 RepID=A0A6C0KN39_9ZZZZ